MLDIFVETVIRNVKRTAFNWNINNNVKVFLTFDQFNVPLLNKSINFSTKLKTKNLTEPSLLNRSVYSHNVRCLIYAGSTHWLRCKWSIQSNCQGQPGEGSAIPTHSPRSGGTGVVMLGSYRLTSGLQACMLGSHGWYTSGAPAKKHVNLIQCQK